MEMSNMASCQTNCTRLPMAPKHKLVQNKMLASHTYTPSFSEGCSWYIVGIGTKCGSNSSDRNVPAVLTSRDKEKPDLDRSIRYHSTGLTMARVMETCRVDCHGIFRYHRVSNEAGRGSLL